MNKVYYAEAVYNNKEINAVTKVLKTQRLSLMDGKNVKIFESEILLLPCAGINISTLPSPFINVVLGRLPNIALIGVCFR